MPSEVVAGRYAEALMGAVTDPLVMQAINEELRQVADIVEGHPQFKTFLEGPSVRTQDKHGLMAKLFKAELNPLTMDYLRLLIDKDRIDHLEPSSTIFQRLVETKRNQVRVEVTTAVPLPADMADRLKRRLDAITSKDTILEPRVDPRIVGGVIVKFEERVIDGSIRTSLTDIKKDLMAANL